MDDLVSFYSSPGVFDVKDHSIIASNSDSPQSFDVAMSQVLSFPNDSSSLYSSHNSGSDNFFPKGIQPQHQANDPSNVYSLQSMDHYPAFPPYSGMMNTDIASQIALFDASSMGTSWDASVPAFGAGHVGSKMNHNSVSNFPLFRGS